MSNPTDNTLIEGSLSVEDALAPTVHGYGGLTVQHDLIVDSSSASENKIQLTADNSSFFTVVDDSETLTLQTTGAGTSQVIVNSAGTGANAIDLNSTVGGVTVDAATSISLDAADDSNFTVTGAAKTLTLASSGTGASQVLVQSSGTAGDAVKVEATDGGILVDANGGDGNSLISIQTDDTTQGIKIGTGTTGVPIFVGTGVKGTPGTSTTIVQGDAEVYGDMIVHGTTTTLNTETLTVEDPIFALNFVDDESGGLDYTIIDGGSRDGFDSGSYHIRAQADICTHTDAKVDAGAATGGSISTVVLPIAPVLGTSPLSGAKYDTASYLNTFVIKITSGPANGDVRRISAWTGSGSYTATVSPDFSFAVVASNTYELYAPAKASIFDESADEFAMIMTGDKHTDTTLEILAYCNLHVNKIIVEEDIVAPCFKTEDIILNANDTSAVDITCSDTRGSFLFMVQGLTDTVSGGPTAQTVGAAATFMISKRDSTLGGASVNRTSHSAGSVVGTNSEKLKLLWPAAGKVQLKHNVSPGGGGGETITYRVRVICI